MLWNPKTTEMTTQRGPAIGSENGLTDNLMAGVSREDGNCEVIRILFKRDSFSQRKQVKLLNSLFSQFTLITGRMGGVSCPLSESAHHSMNLWWLFLMRN